MPKLMGALRSVAMSPALTEVTFAKRGFPVKPSPVTERLELVPQSVICGFEWGIEARGLWEADRRLSVVDEEFRGFACEGVTMAFTIRDMMGRRGHRTQELLTGPGAPHIFLGYIGIGFAMARLPKPLWKKILPDLPGCEYHPIMSWLAVDGYGFDRAYFETAKWVDAQYVPDPYPWQGSPGYFRRAVDQGIGRALWFIHGGDPAAVAAAVPKFASDRHPDLWSGVGLAAAFAGGSEAAALAAMRGVAGEHWTELAVGAVFAAKARAYSGFVPAATHGTVTALTGLPVDAAVAIADDTRPDEPGSAPQPDEVPAYEVWRQNIRNRIATTANSGPAANVTEPSVL